MCFELMAGASCLYIVCSFSPSLVCFPGPRCSSSSPQPNVTPSAHVGRIRGFRDKNILLLLPEPLDTDWWEGCFASITNKAHELRNCIPPWWWRI